MSKDKDLEGRVIQLRPKSGEEVEISILGGDGSSDEQPIRIVGAPNSELIALAEYAVLQDMGIVKVMNQHSFVNNERRYDLLVGQDYAGRILGTYFDITDSQMG